MKKQVGVVLLVLSLFVFAIFSVSGDKNNNKEKDRARFVENELIVKYKDEAKIVVAEDVLSNERVIKENSKVKKFDRIHLLKVRGNNLDKVMDRLRKDKNVEYVEPNYIVSIDVVPNDPMMSSLYGMTKIGAPAAWDITTGSDDIVVAVIDTGVDYTHPDLSNNIWVNEDEITGNGIDDDNNGFIDDFSGWDFYNNDSDPIDDNSHGTHCAGTIGAVGNNEIGVAGVNWNVKIMPLKFLGSGGSGATSNAILAINYAISNGADVMSNSWSGSAYSQALYDAIESANQAGIVFVAAAGNNAVNTDTTPRYPASYNNTNIISVAATDSADALATFSNYGIKTVDLAAPGVSIYSIIFNSSYGYKSGTSMSTPHVAGAAALLKSKYPEMTAAQIKERLLASTDKLVLLTGKMVSGGRLNIYNALMNINPVLAVPCTDSDGGNNIYVKGTSSGLMYNGVYREVQDSCMKPGTNVDAPSCTGTNCYMKEFYCSNNILYVKYDGKCINGCDNGVCLKTILVETYQENATSYTATNMSTWRGTLPKVFDGNWTTLGLRYFNSTYVYVNYNKPANVNSAKWRVKDYGGEFNLTMPSSCLAQTPLQLRIYSYTSSHVSWQCFNGTWHELRMSWNKANWVYEEGMYWYSEKKPVVPPTVINGYQENADETTCNDASCDGNWTSFITKEPNQITYMNYSKQTKYDKAFLKVKQSDFNQGVVVNYYDIKEECMQYNTNKIILENTIGSGGNGYWGCLGSLVGDNGIKRDFWYEIGMTFKGQDVYEEGMLWKTNPKIINNYQEDADKTNCFEDAICDGDWSTGANQPNNSGCGYPKPRYFVYNKPNNSTGAEWKVKFEQGTLTETTIKIPESCWNYDATKIHLSVYELFDDADGENHNTWFACINESNDDIGVVYQPLIMTGQTCSDKVYEEGMYWKIN